MAREKKKNVSRNIVQFVQEYERTPLLEKENHRNLWKIKNVCVKSVVGSVGNGCPERKCGNENDLYHHVTYVNCPNEKRRFHDTV